MLLNSSVLFGTPNYVLMDPIHGAISFFKHEKRILDHPLFQRLRYIKQTDILDFVFPGTTHSRFEHCLGTMYVAGKIFRKMVTGYLGHDSGIILKRDEVHAIQYLYACLRMAALLHDVGCLPFSHQFEDSTAGKKILKNKEIIKKLMSEMSTECLGQSLEHLTHEHYSVLCACRICEDVKDSSDFPFEVEDIVGMMEEAKCIPSESIALKVKSTIKLMSTVPALVEGYGQEEIIKILYSLFKDIISGEVDADKMDYLLRDSYYSGSEYGSYNIHHLIQNMFLGFDLISSNPWVGIAIGHKGLGAFEDFVYSRFRMYLQIYNHKTVVGFKWLIHEAIYEILQKTHYLSHIESALSDINVFKNFTDTYLWEAFRQLAIEKPNSACGRIVYRQRLPHIKAIKTQRDHDVDREKRKLANERNIRVISHHSSSKFSEINPNFDKIRLLTKNPDTGKREIDSIQNHSEFFHKFQNVLMTHFYEDPQFER